jgi:transcriptional regulator with XRE-family HTH domain
MDWRQIPRQARAIRQRLGLRQEDAAAKACVSRSRCSRLERDGAAGLNLTMFDARLGALDARLEVEMRWREATATRVLDEDHAWLVGSVVRQLERWNWQLEIEVTSWLSGRLRTAQAVGLPRE